MDKAIRYARLLTLLFILLMVTLTVGAFVYVNTIASDAVLSGVRERLESTATITASQINGESFQALKDGSGSTPSFLALRDTLWRIKEAEPDIRYIYTMRLNGSRVQFVVDGDYGIAQDAAAPGKVYLNVTPGMMQGFTSPSYDMFLTTDEWGQTISGYAPIRDSRGTTVGLVGVDMDSTDLMQVMNRIKTIDYALLVILIVLFAIGAIIFDIRRSRVEDMSLLAIGKLNQLNSIIRHDIFNTLTGLIGFVEMAQEADTLPEVREKLTTIAGLSNRIQQQISFTRDYQDLGLHMPVWQNVQEIAKKQLSHLDLSGIDVTLHFEGLEVYADLLLNRSFSIILENAIRHGRTVSRIRGYYEQSGDTATIIIEDNGIGVQADKKEMIFTRKEYHDTGLGLFLSREILAMTGITIRENGIPGHGARFEIRVPKGAARLIKT
jgi:sensor histidine kinase regulating citrate/malate metabolism